MNFNQSSQKSSQNYRFALWGALTTLAIAVTAVTSFSVSPTSVSAETIESLSGQPKQNKTNPAIAKLAGQYNLVLSSEDAAIAKNAGIPITGKITISPDGKYNLALNLSVRKMNAVGVVELQKNTLVLRNQTTNGAKNNFSQLLTISQGGKVLQVTRGKRTFRFVKQ